jgi:hypothetical protein
MIMSRSSAMSWGRMDEQGVAGARSAQHTLGTPRRQLFRARIELDSPAEMRLVAEAVQRVRDAHPEYDYDNEYWDLAYLQLACDTVARGVSRRETARRMAKQRRVRWERRRELDKEAYEAGPPSRRRVLTYGAVMTAITAFLIWGLFWEIHSSDKASKPFWLALISLFLLIVGVPLFSGFMARTQMAEPWVPLFRFLDSMRISLSLLAGLAVYVVIRASEGRPASVEYFRAAGELIALLAITLAVEARLSSVARVDVPFRGVMVLFGFAAISYGEYRCLHVIAIHNSTRSDLAVVTGVLVGMAVSIALLAALGPIPYTRSESRPLRPPPPIKPKAELDD